ncbi:uncharacterized protein LOC120712091 isoform X2 [Panicum virgatum]|uniref:uncharacterized protein LOC120712091 isoform X2 n=1 Tax=Panicum virgatum TaxID=38727 RepID=UPI0019D6A0FB|nr:uncharacterized protein LOC120712091 isoform X2 [Panicum virgatum]
MMMMMMVWSHSSTPWTNIILRLPRTSLFVLVFCLFSLMRMMKWESVILRRKYTCVESWIKSRLVHKQVVAWRVGLDCEQPNISVLSTEGKWIKLLNPWKCYKHELARSILITVQMLHFVRRQHRYKRDLWDRLWDHLNEVFIKLGTKPAIYDLRKHHPLIKLFLERDQAFMKLKILHRFIGDITKTMEEALGTKVQFTGSDEPRERNNGADSEYDDDDGNDDSDYDEDINSVGDTNNDDGADTLCALCDDGGNLLSCIGRCKRSFHPRKEDGKESKCKTLGYTSAQLKEIDSYLCKNCEYKQHQCFKCGELEPSAEPNAKYFLPMTWKKAERKLRKQHRKGFNSLCILGAWILWKHRNACVFEGVSPNLQIADKLHSQMQPGDMQDYLMDDSHVDKDAELDNEICRTPEDKDGDGKEKSSEHSVEAEDATNKDTSHENNERNDVLGQINVDIHAEVDQSKFKSRAERSMELRENADGHDSISGQEISIGENQMCQGMCEQESRSGKGKITRNKSAKSGLGNGVTPNHVDDNPREKLLHVPHVDKMTNTNGLHPQPEYGCGKDQEVNGGHAFQEPNSSRCNVNPEAMGIHTLGDKSRKRRELEKKSADDNSTDLDKKKRCSHIQDGKKAHCDDSSRQCHSLHKVLDYEDRKFGNSGRGSRCYDENGAAEISEYKSRQSTGPSSSQCNVDPETMGMHTSGDKSRKRKNLKKKAAYCINTDLDKKKRCNHIEDLKVAHGAAEVSEYKSRQCTGSTGRENVA